MRTQRTDGLIKRIKLNTGDTPSIIGSQSYDELSTQEIEDVNEVINDNTNISAIQVAVNVSHNAAEKFLQNFLANGTVSELRFNVMHRVNNPSQWRLMQLEEEFEERVETHNIQRRQQEEQSLVILSVMWSRKMPSLPPELLRDNLKPFIKSRNKKLVL